MPKEEQPRRQREDVRDLDKEQDRCPDKQRSPNERSSGSSSTTESTSAARQAAWERRRRLDHHIAVAGWLHQLAPLTVYYRGGLVDVGLGELLTRRLVA